MFEMYVFVEVFREHFTTGDNIFVGFLCNY